MSNTSQLFRLKREFIREELPDEELRTVYYHWLTEARPTQKEQREMLAWCSQLRPKLCENLLDEMKTRTRLWHARRNFDQLVHEGGLESHIEEAFAKIVILCRGDEEEISIALRLLDEHCPAVLERVKIWSSMLCDILKHEHDQ